jgi:hypothetical protein
MPGMNDYLAQLYGTTKTAAAPVVSDDELQKQASVDMFCKVAAAEDIDLSALPDDQVQYLYGEFMKAAGENPFAKKDGEGEPEKKDEKDEKEKKDEEEKHAAAAAEHAQKLAATEKLAEADYIGRVIAHSFVQELSNISKEASVKEATGVDRDAVLNASALARNSHVRRALGQGKQIASKAVDAVKEHGKKLHEGAGKHLESVGHKITGAHGNMGKVSPETAKRVGGAAYGAGAAAAGGAAVAAHHHAKHGSAFEQVAAETAVSFAASQDWDAEEAGRKVAAVLELGLLGESEKVASEVDYQTSVGIRALEMLECAGYPVTWTT